MIARLLSGILTAVFLPLGIVFTVLGLVIEQPDSGSPEGFLYTGLAILAVGVGFLVTFLVLRGREAARRRRRQEGRRVSAQVVRVKLRPGVRVGSMITVDLTVRFPGANTPDGTVTRTLLLSPLAPVREGDTVDVLYDPEDPANFELAGG